EREGGREGEREKERERGVGGILRILKLAVLSLKAWIYIQKQHLSYVPSSFPSRMILLHCERFS
ncbi:hypothetical protein ACQP3L_39250, partial [Escherichia coli]